MKLCKCGCGNEVTHIKNKFISGHNSRMKEYSGGKFEKGRKNSIDVRKKLSNSLKGRFLKEESSQWKGGCDTTLHNQARDLFGKYYCEDCNISLEDHLKKCNRNFDMHNTTNNYKDMFEGAWKTYCRKCHNQIHKQLRKQK